MTEARLVRTFMTLSGMYILAASLIWSVNTLFLLDAGLSISEVFIANALFSVGTVLFEIPTGVVADTVGRRASYLISVAILAVTTGLYLWAAEAGSGVVVFSAVSVLMGLGFTFYSGAIEAWLVDALASIGAHHQLDSIFARTQQVTGAAMLVGTISGGLFGQLDLAFPFVVRSVLLVGVFAIAWLAMHDIGFTPSRVGLSEIPRAMKQNAALGVAHGWRQPGLRMLMLAAAARGVFFGWAFYAAQPYFLELMERDAVWVVGIITSGLSLATIAGNQVVQLLSKRCRKRSTLLLGAAAVSTLFSVLMGVASNLPLAVLSFFIVAMAMGVDGPVRQAYLHGVTESENRATVVSFDSMISSIGGAGGQIGLGRIADARSLSAGYVTGGLATVLALPFLLVLRRIGGAADQIVPDESLPASCAVGLPSETHVSDRVVAESELV